jgi:hypothetical protein
MKQIPLKDILSERVTEEKIENSNSPTSTKQIEIAV